MATCGDPCLLAAAATVPLIIILWLTRWRGLRAVNVERRVLAAFLVGMPLVYVARYLFASQGHGADFGLWVEVLGVFIFAVLAVLCVKHSPWFLAIGIGLHGLAWDSWHLRNSTFMPGCYAIACFEMDLVLGAYVAARVPAYRRESRH